ncbi:LITAF domain-containing protein-like [Dermatophagoides farinae]|uniref:LITAF domain-containing protein n=1 Tax=Dermatophagoides farinae TaxID=6954 RepID=A0A922IBN8_DERFA|nr:hypothetical protein DERF_002052 [Dermatophagoides farinae]
MGKHRNSNRQKNNDVIIIINDKCLDPISMECPYCHLNIVTRIRYMNGLLTYILCCGLLLVGCWYGCCLIPFCMPACQDVEHYCPKCGMIIHNAYRI